MKKDQIDKYKFHKKFCKSKLESLVKELHNAYVIRNTYYQIVTTYKHLINLDVYNFERLTKLVHEEFTSFVPLPKKVLNVDNEELEQYIMQLLNYLNYVCATKIPEIKRLLELYNMVIEIPYPELLKVYRVYNRCCANHLLLGNVIKLPKGLGRFGVEMNKRPPDKFAINWKDSHIYRRYLVNNNITPKSTKDPDGEQWLIAFNDDYYIRWKWKRNTTCNIPNNRYYTFKVKSYLNDLVDNIEERLNTKEEVLNSSDIGNLQKSLMLSRKFNDIKEVYHYGI